MLRVIHKLYSAALFRQTHQGRTLNVGGTGMEAAVNFDLQYSADVMGDAHELDRHFAPESFDVVVCTAVLQYCREPQEVVAQIAYVLRAGGHVYVDVPWVQPGCRDGVAEDLWRFSDRGLRVLLEDAGLTVLDTGVSIPAAGALAFLTWRALPRPIGWLVRPLLWAVSVTRLGREPKNAGAFYAVARRP